MDEQAFWGLIAGARREASDVEDFLEALAEGLAALAPEAIIGFQRQLDARIDEANSFELWAAAYLINGGASDDGFLYFRYWLVAQGEAVFRAARKDPESLAEVEDIEEPAELEELAYVAPSVFEIETGKPLPTSAAPSGKTRGQIVDAETVEQRYPRLAARFGGD